MTNPSFKSHVVEAKWLTNINTMILPAFQDRIYWTDRDRAAVLMANRLTGQDIQTLAENLNDPHDIVVFHQLLQPQGVCVCVWDSMKDRDCARLLVNDVSPRHAPHLCSHVCSAVPRRASRMNKSCRLLTDQSWGSSGTFTHLSKTFFSRFWSVTVWRRRLSQFASKQDMSTLDLHLVAQELFNIYCKFLNVATVYSFYSFRLCSRKRKGLFLEGTAEVFAVFYNEIWHLSDTLLSPHVEWMIILYNHNCVSNSPCLQAQTAVIWAVWPMEAVSICVLRLRRLQSTRPSTPAPAPTDRTWGRTWGAACQVSRFMSASWDYLIIHSS